jgi:hypothetical protein
MNRDWAKDLALCEAATPGPWGIDKAVNVWIMAGNLHVATIPRAHDGDWSPANAEFITTSRTAWPASIRRVMELEAWQKAIKQEMSKCDYFAAGLRASKDCPCCDRGCDQYSVCALLKEVDNG